MNNSIERAKLASEAIAHARLEDLSDEFTLQELQFALKKWNCPYSSLLIWGLKSSKLIVKSGKYLKFVSLEPIHFSKLTTLLDGYSAKQAQYQKNSKEKKGNVKAAIVGKNVSEDEAIALLKSLGYKVMRPITNYEEC